MKSLHGCVCVCVYLCVCGCVLVSRRDCEHDARAAEYCASESFWSQSRALSLGREQYTWREVCSSVCACLAAAPWVGLCFCCSVYERAQTWP